MRSKNYWLFSIISIVVLLDSNRLIAQVTSNGESSFINVGSYNGVTVPNAFTYRININGNNINHPNWALMVCANPTITNSNGKIMDPSKISIRLNNVSGGPTVQSIGASQTPFPLSFVNQPLFTKSNYPIKHGVNEYYSQYVFSFDIIIKNGEYLQELKDEKSYYKLGLTFTVLKVSGELLTQASIPIEIKIYPLDTPPITPTYSIQVNTNARNGLLEFKTLSDYVNGVSQSYSKGLTITSNTPYAVQVKSLTTNFESGSLTLPVNTVSLEIKDPGNINVGGTIALSENVKTVFNATNLNTQPRLFDIRYFTQANDQRMLNAKPANYQSTLLYTLIPQ